MSTFLDILPLIFYCIAGIIAIVYEILFIGYKFKVTKNINRLFFALVLFFAILSIASSILFWFHY